MTHLYTFSSSTNPEIVRCESLFGLQIGAQNVFGQVLLWLFNFFFETLSRWSDPNGPLQNCQDKIDIICMQEGYGPKAQQFAKELGYQYHNRRVVAIYSTLPMKLIP